MSEEPLDQWEQDFRTRRGTMIVPCFGNTWGDYQRGNILGDYYGPTNHS